MKIKYYLMLILAFITFSMNVFALERGIYKVEANDPSTEFRNDFTEFYNSKSNPKAHGLELVLSYPISWKAKEGVRPHILQSFISENGKGLENFNIGVRKLPSIPSKEEALFYFSNQEFKEMLPNNCDYISSKEVVIDRFNGGMMLGYCTHKRLDLTFRTIIQFYMTIVEDKAIFLTFLVGSNNDNKKQLQEKFKRFEPLYKLIANSLVVQNQYY